MFDQLVLCENSVFSRQAAMGFNTPNAGCNGSFMTDPENSQVAGIARMCSAAQFSGILRVDNNYPYRITVLLTEECHGTQFQRVFTGHFTGYDRYILPDLLVYKLFDLLNFLICHFRKMGKVEA